MKNARDLERIAGIRMAAFSAIRSFFIARGFTEVEAPLLVASPDMEPTLSPMETRVVRPDRSFLGALITSPEYSMKKLLGGGLENIFYLGKVFRNGEAWDATHATEFTMLEWYRSGSDYRAGMEETRALVAAVAFALSIVEHPLLHHWKFLRIEEAFASLADVPNVGRCSLDELCLAADRLGIHRTADDTWSDVFYRIYLSRIEPFLSEEEATVLYDYPLPQAALSRPCPDGVYAERFELFSGRLELCNAFTELTDATEQRRRFQAESEERSRLGKTVFPIDEALLALLPSLRQPTFGNALGVDRLLLALLQEKDIRHVLLFSPEDAFPSSLP